MWRRAERLCPEKCQARQTRWRRLVSRPSSLICRPMGLIFLSPLGRCGSFLTNRRVVLKRRCAGEVRCSSDRAGMFSRAVRPEKEEASPGPSPALDRRSRRSRSRKVGCSVGRADHSLLRRRGEKDARRVSSNWQRPGREKYPQVAPRTRSPFFFSRRQNIGEGAGRPGWTVAAVARQGQAPRETGPARFRRPIGCFQGRPVLYPF